MDIFYTHQHHLHATDGLTYEDRPYQIEEVPERVEIIRRALEAARLGEMMTPEDRGLTPIVQVHTPGFVEFLRTTWQAHADFYHKPAPVLADTLSRGGRRKPRGPLGLSGYYGFGIGSPIVQGTWEAAYWAAQCALGAAARVQDGARAAFALCRPPGHHAAVEMYGGFCYLNNAAIAARALPGRTAILDIDYHHGNGTQEIFYADPGVLYCSLHADPDDEYPFYWGGADERGEGAGLGSNLNFPLPLGTEDDVYLRTLDAALAQVSAFRPRWLVLSAGLDIARGDPVGGFKVSVAGMRSVGRRIAALGLPAVIVQEGGYKLDTLGEYAVALLEAFR